MMLNWNFLGGGGCKTKKPSMEEVWIFSGAAHCNNRYCNVDVIYKLSGIIM